MLLVEGGHEGDFEEYLSVQRMRVVAWLDDDDAAAAAIDALERG